MSEINDILTDIQQHCTREYNEHVTDPSIGRGLIRIKGAGSQTKIWIVNREYERRSVAEVDINNTVKGTRIVGREQYLTGDGVNVSKNKMYGRLLLENYEGNHVCRTTDGRTFDFMIKNSESYINERGTVSQLRFGIAGDKDWSRYPTLKAAIEALSKNEESIREKQIEEEMARKRAEELRKRQQEEEARKAEEEARKFEEERKALEAERQSIIDKYSQKAAFIRKQVALRNNPVLDKCQNSAKFSNVFNGIAEVINGGPGTGKTTTMIQRLKLLIDKGDLEDYRVNYKGCNLTDTQIATVSAPDSWMYFSPNQLLKKYLQDNMNYEGLTGTSSRTMVWKDFLMNAVRDYYQIAGSDYPFDFPKHKYEDVPIFIDEHYEIISAFIDYFIAQTKEKFLKISKVETSKFDWKILGDVIKKECAKAEDVKTLTQLLQYLIHIEHVDENIFVGNQRIESGAAINSRFNNSIQSLTDSYVVKIKNDESLYSQLLKFINDTTKNQERQEEDEDDEDVIEVEQNYGEVALIVNQKMNALLKRLALKTIDSTVKIQGAQQALYEIIKGVIIEDDLKALGQDAYFVKYVYPALRGSLNTIFSSVPRIYKSFRKNLPEELKDHWNTEILQYILEKTKNRALCPQEQALLVGFINRICRDYYKVRRTDFMESKHKYVEAYRSLCRPVIGVDEATDYSIVDYFGIRSFGHYEIESFTLCGDSMQMMREDGIYDWNILRHPLIFENLDIQSLNVSYRQSKGLMDLAGKIYQAETGRPSPYVCYLKNEDTPKPLWIEDSDIDEKAEWITSRVLEIKRNYGEMPTIAIFAKDIETCNSLKDALDDCDGLSREGIKVKVNSDDALSDPTILRIFPINEVKGMEFEAVFFYDIDDIDSTSLVNKYLYVGISRAAFYLAVTSNGQSRRVGELLSQYFEKGQTWR